MKGWEIKKLSQLFDVKSSRRVHQADWKSSGIPFYRAREVPLKKKEPHPFPSKIQRIRLIP
jgi:type I restriction enzyme, S subunit